MREPTLPQLVRPQSASVLLVDCGPQYFERKSPHLERRRLEIEKSTGMPVRNYQASPGLPRGPWPGLTSAIVHFLGNLQWSLDLLQEDTELRQLEQAAQITVFEQIGLPSAGAGWPTMGQQIAARAHRQNHICLIQWPSKDEDDPAFVGWVYGNCISQALRGAWPETNTPPKYRGSPALSLYAGATRPAPTPSPPHVAGRSFRQVTTLSYDIVGSTSLIERMGADLYSIALQDCHTRFANVVRIWGGVSDQPQGDDGIMCYFGTLVAAEDTASRAVHAALELTESSAKLGIDIRVGLATGQVAVSSDHVVGLAVHLAARIQGLAQVGQVLVSEATALLTVEQFEYELVADNKPLKGFSAPTKVYQLNKVLPRRTKYVLSRTQTDLVGRTAELSWLKRHWDAASAGQSRWLHLTGEAGIGKTRLMTAFCAGIGDEGGGRTHLCRCFQENINRPFGPIIDLLERWFLINAADDDIQRQAKLDAVFSSNGSENLNRSVISFLLGMPGTVPVSDIVPANETRRHFILRTSTNWLLDQAEQRPLCLVLEDVQWIDPSTHEFLQTLKAKSSASRLLVVLTERADAQSPEKSALTDDFLHLSGLDATAAQSLVLQLTEENVLPKALVAQIVGKSDGVPLFVEMCARMAIEANLANHPGTHTGTPSGLPIPMTINGLLTQRLDNLGPARYLAGVCSVIGRSISLELLHGLASDPAIGMSPYQAKQHLATLLKSGLIVPSTDLELATYHFRHALVQEAAYQSLWDADRLMLHKAISEMIASQFPSIASSQPEVMARHCAACGSRKEAAKWHLLAAKKFKTSAGHQESLSHLNLAQEMVGSIADSEAKNNYSLEIHLAMAGQLTALKGSGSDGVGENYMAALALGHKLRDQRAILRSELGIQSYHFLRGDFAQAHAYIERARQSAKGFNDTFVQAQCSWALANLLFHQGEMETSLWHMLACVKACRSAEVHSTTLQSPEVMSLMYASFCQWQLGRPFQGLAMAQEAVELAERLEHRLGIGQALGMQSLVFLVCGDAEQALAASQRAVDICVAGEHEMWAAHARFMHGAARAALGDLEGGLEAMAQADNIWAATGAVLTRTFYLEKQAKARAELNDIPGALATINQAKSIVERFGERYWEPEILRIEAEILFVHEVHEHDRHVRCMQRLQRAKNCADERGMTSQALRIATSLALQRRENDDFTRATATLESALAAVEKNALTQDIVVAQNLLADLRMRAI